MAERGEGKEGRKEGNEGKKEEKEEREHKHCSVTLLYSLITVSSH